MQMLGCSWWLIECCFVVASMFWVISIVMDNCAIAEVFMIVPRTLLCSFLLCSFFVLGGYWPNNK